MASGAPKTSPTKRLYSLQAMPNWNSCTMPVATPMMKLIRKSLPQNLVIRRYSGLPVRCHSVWITATTRPEADRQRHHHEVVDGGDSELPACDFQGVQGSPYFWLGLEQVFYVT